MEVFKVDNRNRNDLIALIERLSKSYTPEWKFDVSNPDATSVIGMIYANQTFNNIKNLNQLLTKYHIEFANMYGVSPKGACASKTICIFNINENMQSGVELRKGTQVIGTNEDGDEVLFALCHDISTTTAMLTDIMAVSGSRRSINVYRGDFKTFDYKDGEFYNFLPENYEPQGIPLFDYKGKNAYKQAVVIYFNKFPDMDENLIRFKFEGNLSSEVLAELFCDREKFQLSYMSQEGVIPFDDVVCEGGFVEIRNRTVNKDREDEDTLADKGMTIILEQKQPVEENISLEKIEMFTQGWDKKAEFLWNGKTELVEDTFMPFTNQPALYNEFYIGQGFLLEQYGAKVKLHFRLEFDTYNPQKSAVYEPDLRVIKRKPKTEYAKPHYECFVQEVSFDYFNGRGWKRLDTDKDMTAIFSKTEYAGEYDICFEVPSDWKSVVVGGYEGNCIRIQIVKADNCYMSDVEYYYPIISDFKLCMDSQLKGVAPTEVTSIHGQVKEKGALNAFTSMQYDGDYLFLGFDSRFTNGPVALFADMQKQLLFKGVELEFSYSCQKGFKPLKVIDDTNYFQNSGLIMFMPPADMNEYEVEGTKRYWIRIADKNRYFSAKGRCVPVLENIFVNAAYVENVTELEEQDYYIDTVTSYMRFPLYAQNVLSADIWVNEKEQLSYDEMERLEQSKDVETRTVCNFLGEIEEFYVLWQEIDSFDEVKENRRCYCIDRSKNELIFGDGVHSDVPQNTAGVAFKAKVRFCDGENANIAPFSIDRFRSSIISVEDVTNPVGAYGGTNLENINDALKRGSNILSSRKRLVSKDDYVKEAYLFSDTIEQVACVLGNMENDRSVISLVLLMKDYRKGDFSFRNIQDKLKEHLLSCCEITCSPSDLMITEPVFVNISIDIWLTMPDMSKSLEIKQLWLDKITDYLEPAKSVRGNGWQIGKLPGTKQIRLMLSTLEGIATIENINIMASYTQNRKRYEISIDRIDKNPFMICCNGVHNIYINGI